MPTLFKTHDTCDSSKDCAIWEVARATSAATTFFKSITCGRDEIEFIDAGFGYNNPCDILVREAQALFPNDDLDCILSIGTGIRGAVSINNTRKSILDALKAMATSSQKVAQRLESVYSDGALYYRFDVSYGLEDIVLSDWKETSRISAHTRNYLAENEGGLAKCCRSMLQHDTLTAATGSAVDSFPLGESE